MPLQTSGISRGIGHAFAPVAPGGTEHSKKTVSQSPVAIPSLPQFRPGCAPLPQRDPLVAQSPDDAYCSRPIHAFYKFWTLMSPVSTLLREPVPFVCWFADGSRLPGFAA